MKLLTFNEDSEIDLPHDAGTCTFKQTKGTDYVYPEAEFVKWMNRAPHTLARVTDLNSITRNFCVNGTRGQLLYYCGGGGIGDEIMGIPIVLHLAELGYEVTVLCDPKHDTVWENCPDIRGVLHMPLEYRVWAAFDHHCIYDHITNLVEHPWQRHPTEVMAMRIGLDPQEITCLCHNLWFTDEERSLARARQAKVGNPRAGFYQLSSSAPLRRMSPLHSAQVLKALCREFPDVYWTAVYDGAVPKQYVQLADAVARVYNNTNTAHYQSLRTLYADTEIADIVVAPDSMMCHLGGTMNVPTVGLFSNISPDKRLSRYPSAVGLWNFKSCHAAPCYSHRRGWPEMCPPSPQPRDECECIKTIDTKDIIRTVKEILHD